MHVVVTGAAGFIGSHTCERLVARGPPGHRHRRVRRLSVSGRGQARERRRARAAAGGFELVEADICDRGAIAARDRRRRRRRVPPRRARRRAAVARRAAALPAHQHRGHRRDPRAHARARPARLVFASSSSVYGAQAGRRRSRRFARTIRASTPASPYAATKRMNELQLSAYRDLFGIGVFALRFFTVYGPRQRPDMAIAKFIARDRARRADRAVRRRHRRGATTRSSTTSSPASSRRSSGSQPGRYEIYNLGGTQTIALRELVAIIERVVGKPRDRSSASPISPATFRSRTRTSIARARRSGYAPTTSIELGVARYWDWLRR